MTSSEITPFSTFTEVQANELLGQMKTLVGLVPALMALLSGAATMTGGAGQRLEELIEKLTLVAAGLDENVNQLKEIFGPDGVLTQMVTRMAQIEKMMQHQEKAQAATRLSLSQIEQWMAGAA